MSIEFETAAAELEDYLKPLVPKEWVVQDATKPLGKTTKVILTYMQGNASARLDGNVLGAGQVGVEFALVLRTPETDPLKGWPRLNKAAPHLFRALDAHPQLLWETAEAGVQQSGESFYAIAVQVIATYTTTTAGIG